MSFLNKPLVLRLNRGWQPIGRSTVKDALVAMSSGDEFIKAATAIDIQYVKNESGEWDFSNPVGLVPVSWSDWVNLPVRDFDLVIRTSRISIRVPTVIIANNYAKMPIIKTHPTNSAIWKRDNGVCQISGEKVTKNSGNIEHLTPRSRGGKNTFKNLVLVKKELNSIKGDRTLNEMGWKLIREPAEPMPVPASATIRELSHRDWAHFLTVK